MQCSAPPGYGGIHRQDAPRKGRHHGLLEPVAQQASLGWVPPFGQQHRQLQFVKGDRREEQAAVPRQSAPCATPQQGWYQPDPSEEISRPGQLPVVRQGEIEILHPGHGEQIDSNTWAGRPRSVMNTGPWLAARLAGGGIFQMLHVAGNPAVPRLQ